MAELEIIAVDEQQKIYKVGDKTIYLGWNKYANCWEAEIFRLIQDQYGRFVNEYATAVTGNSEKEAIQQAMQINI
tara:strand:+ start:1293 stop:1517 length:225 start_codon:yes stop_codon:yes gene_type:complete